MSVKTIKIITIVALFAAIIFNHCATRAELDWKKSNGYRWAELPVLL